MNILVLSYIYPPDAQGGYELGCKQAVDALRRRGHNVRVLTSTPRTPVRPEPHVSRKLHLTDIWYNATRPVSHPAVNQVWEVDANLFSSHNVHLLIQEIKDFQPDVVYVWMINGLGGLGLMGCLQYLGVPWVWHLMDEVPAMLCSNNWHVVPKLAQAFNRFISGHYISCSETMLRRIRAKGVILDGDVRLLPNWVTGRRPAPRTRFYNSGELRIVSAGRVTRDKGMDILVEAARILRDEGQTNFSVDVYGPIVDRSIPELVSRYSLESLVQFHGSIPQAELTRQLSEYDVFAFATEAREPFGFAPLEAAAQGCVPVITRSCGIAEWLVDGVHCVKVQRDARSFAHAIGDVLGGRIDLAPIGRRGQAAVWRDFSIDVIIPKIEDMLACAASSAQEASGDFDDAYRMAVIAERLAHAIVQEPFCA